MKPKKPSRKLPLVTRWDIYKYNLKHFFKCSEVFEDVWARNDICKWPDKGWPILNDSYVMIQKTSTPVIQSTSVQITSTNCEELELSEYRYQSYRSIVLQNASANAQGRKITRKILFEKQIHSRKI